LSTVFLFTANCPISNFVLYIALSGRMFCGFVFFPKALPLGYYILGFQPYAQKFINLLCLSRPEICLQISLSTVNCQLSID
jgi:hypothetical protein